MTAEEISLMGARKNARLLGRNIAREKRLPIIAANIPLPVFRGL